MLVRGSFIHAVIQGAFACWNSSPLNPPVLFSQRLYFPGTVLGWELGGGGVEGDWGRITPMNGRGLSKDLGWWASLMSFYPLRWEEMEGSSTALWVPSPPVFTEDMAPSTALVSVTVSVCACHQAWCCMSMTSHKSRQEEACETASHERNKLAGGEMLAGVYVVKPASFSL